MGKLMERMVLARIQWNAEQLNVFHPTQTGFRKNLGTHDSLAMIFKDVASLHESSPHLRVLVSIDIKKAFDTVPHDSIIKAMEEAGLTGRQLNFVKSFLDNRRYLIRAGYGKDSQDGPTKENNIGVPQGAVLSPTLFNIVMAPLLWELHKIPQLKATAYADDITIWTHIGTEDIQKRTLQRGLDTIDRYLQRVGMQPSSEKTKYTTFGKGHENKDLGLTFAGNALQCERFVKILGINFGYKRSLATEWVKESTKKWRQGLQLVRRIASRLGGAGEKSAKTLVTAVLMAKVTYAARFYKLRSEHFNKFDTLYNEARRAILGLPRTTRLNELRKCAFLPSLQDSLRQQREMQVARLEHTVEGRAIAKYLGVQIQAKNPMPRAKPPWELIDIAQKPLPRNMNAEKHQKRREHHARLHLAEVSQLNHEDNQVVYVDAATNATAASAAVVFVREAQDAPLTVRKVHTKLTSPQATEEAAILLALQTYENLATSNSHTRNHLTIYTDSQEAIRSLVKHHTTTTSPTIAAIFQSALRIHREHGTKTSVRWATRQPIELPEKYYRQQHSQMATLRRQGT